MVDRKDELVAKLLAAPADGRLQNELLEISYGSSHFDFLGPLLSVESSEASKIAGLFIFSELGARARSGFSLVRPLFKSDSPRIRARVADVLAHAAPDARADDVEFLVACLSATETFVVRRASRSLLGFPRSIVEREIQRHSVLSSVFTGALRASTEAECTVFALGACLRGEEVGADEPCHAQWEYLAKALLLVRGGANVERLGSWWR